MSAVVALSLTSRTCYSSNRLALRLLSCTSDRKLRSRTILVFKACYARPHAPHNPYPYPKHPSPTPHQIFHLPKGASKEDVKARYYDLVRIYHPDSPVNHSVPPQVAQSRFHAISAAYDVLRGKPSAHYLSGDVGVGEAERKRSDFHDLSTAMWRARQRKRADVLNFGGGGLDDKWKDRLMFGLIFLTIAAFVAQTYTTRAQAISSAHAARLDSPNSYRNGISRPPFKSSSSAHSHPPPPHEPALAAEPSPSNTSNT